MHQRQIIREAIRDILLNKTKAKARVYTNRASLNHTEEMPVIVIFPQSEDVTVFNESPRQLKKILSVVIEIGAIGQEQPVPGEKLCGPFAEDILDDLAEEVECELSRDDTIGGAADDITPASTEFDFRPEGSEPIGTARLVYAVTYYEFSPATRDKQTQINEKDLKQIKNNWDFAEPDGIIEAKDTIDLE